MLKKAALIVIIGLVIIVSGYYLFFEFNPCFLRGGGGITVIAPAKNPVTGEIRNFPSSCDVPFGWQPYDMGGFYLPN